LFLASARIFECTCHNALVKDGSASLRDGIAQFEPATAIVE